VKDFPTRSPISQAVDLQRRKRILESANAGFAAMKREVTAWREELDDRKNWESTVADGLSDVTTRRKTSR
jgi:hypothetical protein